MAQLPPWAALALLAVGAAGLGACGDSKIDAGKAEAAIQRDLARRTGLAIASVSCPDDVEAKRGDTFRCLAVARNGDRASVLVTQRDDEGTVSWRVVRTR